MDEQRTSAASGEHCASCVFWKRNEKPLTRGICRFDPPRAGFIPGRAAGAFTAGPDSTITVWPDTAENDWCGKFQSSAVFKQSSRSDGFGFELISPGWWRCLRCGCIMISKGCPPECVICKGAFSIAKVDKLYPPAESDNQSRQTAEFTRDLLLLVDVDVPVETITTWTCEQQNQAKGWVRAVYLCAADHDLQVPPRPKFLPPPETEKRLKIK